MKIIQINTDANWGSHGRIAEDLGNMMMMNGWESYIAYGRCHNPSRSNLIRIDTVFGNYSHAVETRLFDNHGLSSRNATKKFVKKIFDINPDLLHLHNLHGYYLNYEILFDGIKELKKPVVWTFHDCWPFTGHCAYPVYCNCDKWKTQCHSCNQIQNYPKSFIDRSSYNFNKKKNVFLSLDNLHIVAVSDWLKEQTRMSFFKDTDIHRIYNGIDTNVFKPFINKKLKMELGLSDNKKMILGVASLWEERKGLKDFEKLRELLPKDYIIVLVGLDKKQKNKISSDFIVFERTNDISELVELYSLADVYVNPSVAETFGMTTAEALACGTPAVVYNATACPELVDEETGRVVEVGDIDGLAQAIKDLVVKNKKEVSHKCVERANALFNKKERYQDYLQLYSVIL